MLGAGITGDWWFHGHKKVPMRATGKFDGVGFQHRDNSTHRWVMRQEGSRYRAVVKGRVHPHKYAEREIVALMAKGIWIEQ